MGFMHFCFALIPFLLELRSGDWHIFRGEELLWVGESLNNSSSCPQIWFNFKSIWQTLCPFLVFHSLSSQLDGNTNEKLGAWVAAVCPVGVYPVLEQNSHSEQRGKQECGDCGRKGREEMKEMKRKGGVYIESWNQRCGGRQRWMPTGTGNQYVNFL